MAIYLNPGFENFSMTLRAPIYVDKTMMLEVLNGFIDQGNKYICVSRPRRFGKTIAGNMISAYYSKGCDSSELFENLNIAKSASYEEKLNHYNVIQIDLNSEYQNAEDKNVTLSRLIKKIKDELRDQFPFLKSDEMTLAEMLLKVYSDTGETFVFVIDEYDVLVRERVDQTLFDQYMSFLNGLFKSNTLSPAISLAYITGILPVVRDRIQSKLNNFREYTMLEAGELAPFIGFTGAEVKNLCEKYKTDFEECKRWYDGYRQRDMEIYNPESVVECVRTGYYENYWGKTSSYAVIADLIRQNFEGTKDDVIHMLAGEEVDVNVTAFMNTMTDFRSKSDVFTYLIQVGYLAYNKENGTCRIPNREIRGEWLNAVETEPDYKETDRIIKSSRQLLEDTINGNEEAVAKALDISHIHVTSNRSYNNEDALQSAIYLAFIYALNKYTVIREMTSGKGFADVVFIPFCEKIPAMVIELKRNGSAQSGLEQIRQKRYFDSLQHYRGDLLLVAINYDEKGKTHSCRIERVEK